LPVVIYVCFRCRSEEFCINYRQSLLTFIIMYNDIDSSELSIDDTCKAVSIPVTEVWEARKIALTFCFGTPAYALKLYKYH
jgi:hypothetical protein